jgi:hypothetical protein
MNNQTAEFIGFLKGLTHVQNYCSLHLQVHPDAKEILKYNNFILDEKTLENIRDFCEEQINTYKELVKMPE